MGFSLPLVSHEQNPALGLYRKEASSPPPVPARFHIGEYDLSLPSFFSQLVVALYLAWDPPFVNDHESGKLSTNGAVLVPSRI